MISAEKLVGGSVYHKNDHIIRKKNLDFVKDEFSRIKSLYGKCFYIALLIQHSDKEVEQIGKKLYREVCIREPELYHRRLKYLFAEVLKQITLQSGNVGTDLVDMKMEYGVMDLLLICRLMMNKTPFLAKTIGSRAGFGMKEQKEISKQFLYERIF